MVCLRGDLERNAFASRWQPNRARCELKASRHWLPSTGDGWPVPEAGRVSGLPGHERRHTARGDWHPPMETVNGHATLVIEQRELLALCHYWFEPGRRLRRGDVGLQNYAAMIGGKSGFNCAGNILTGCAVRIPVFTSRTRARIKISQITKCAI